MSIKQHGGIFGRNPKFNNVDVAGTLTVDGSFVVNGSSMAPIYKGTWDANTNSPTLTSSVGVQGNFYIVSTAGTTTLNGISTWNVGDWALYNGVAWQKVEGGTSGNFATLTVTGAGEFGDGTVITPSITNIGDVDTGLYFPADNTLGITTAGTERMRVTSTNTVEFTANAEFADGLAASPSITNIGDTNTGLYFPSADAIGIVTGGVDRIRITSTGNVGVGTIGPSVKLETTDTSNGATLELLRLSNTGTGANTKSRLNFYAASTNYGAITGGFGASSPEMVFDINTTNGAFIWNSVSTERMRIDASGNLGLGVTPSAWSGVGKTLQINTGGSFSADAANAYFAANAYYNGTNWIYQTTNNSARYNMTGSGQHQWFNAPSGTAGNAISFTQAMTLDASGNLGIGTSSPAYKLDIGGINPRIRINETTGYVLTSYSNTGGSFDVGRDNSAGLVSGTAYAGFLNVGGAYPLIFNTNSAERMRIDASGNVGIGATSVTAIYGRTLQIGSGTSEATTSLVGSTGSVFLATVGATGQLIARGGMALVLGSNDLERMRITSTGNVGIGAIPTGYGKLEVYQSANNRILFSGASAYGNNAIAGINDVGAEVSMGIAGSPVAFYTNATERMRITSTGNVGIGTSSPVNTTGYGGLTLNGTSGAIVSMMENGTETFRLTNATGYSFVNTTGSTPLLFGTAATERMRITSAGNVGIGTSSPGYNLDVAGSFRMYQSVAAGYVSPVFENSNATGYVQHLFNVGSNGANGQAAIGYVPGNFFAIGPTSNDTSTPIVFRNNNATERMRITSAGDVGIGTSSPAQKLDVANGFAIIGANSANPGVGGNIRFRDDTGTPRWLSGLLGTAGATAYSIYDIVAGAERLSITSTGNVGIGTGSPGYKLSVEGTAGTAVVNLLETGVRSWGIRAGGAATNTFDIADFTAGATRLTVDASGNLGLGVTPSAWSGVTAMQINTASIWGAGTSNAEVGANEFYNGTARTYITSNAASMYNQSGGIHSWHTAPSGTAGNAISFTQAMTLDASGNLLVGTTSNPGVLNTSVVVNSGASSLAGLVLQNNATGSTSTDGSHITTVGTELWIVNLENAATLFSNNGSERLRITSAGNIHTPAGATTMTNGFFYIPAAAGVPTGVPTAITGTVPMYYDTTNNKFYVYNGAWKSVTLT